MLRSRAKYHTKPRLTVTQILEWADQSYRRNGHWPHHFTGRIKSAVDETWGGVNDALARGSRGLPGGSTLARLLYRRRGVRSPRNVPPLSEGDILRWTKSHFRQMGTWPKESCGPVKSAPGETWAAVDLALQRGTRGLPGGSSLARLLDSQGIKRNPRNHPLTEKQVLAWADEFFHSHGYWPFRDSGVIDGSSGETWFTINKAFMRGQRGLSRTTLVVFLEKHRGILGGKTRRPRRIPESKRLRLEQIAAWGKAYRRRHGIFPNRHSGSIPDVEGLKWSAIDSALKSGSRGLLGGSSLAKLFGDRRFRKWTKDHPRRQHESTRRT